MRTPGWGKWAHPDCSAQAEALRSLRSLGIAYTRGAGARGRLPGLGKREEKENPGLSPCPGRCAVACSAAQVPLGRSLDLSEPGALVVRGSHGVCLAEV